MKVLICGGRDMDRVTARNWLERNAKDEISFATGLHSFSIERIIHGGCRGADEGADDWAKSESIPVIRCPANWKKHGKAAGPIRNREMVRIHQPDCVIALPGGRGTQDMISVAEAAGITVIKAKI